MNDPLPNHPNRSTKHRTLQCSALCTENGACPWVDLTKCRDQMNLTWGVGGPRDLHHYLQPLQLSHWMLKCASSIFIQ